MALNWPWKNGDSRGKKPSVPTSQLHRQPGRQQPLRDSGVAGASEVDMTPVWLAAMSSQDSGPAAADPAPYCPPVDTSGGGGYSGGDGGFSGGGDGGGC